MLIYAPGENVQRKQLTEPPDAETLHKIIGGYFELVPYFHSIKRDDGEHRCVAFCNEDGKRLLLPINDVANLLWDDALQRSGHTDVRYRVGNFMRAIGHEAALGKDFLVGPVVVLYGDDEFMESL